MNRSLLSAVGGFVLALGLGIAGMTDPRRIVGFLDFSGNWDATALIVMAAASAVYALGYRAHAAAFRRVHGRTSPPVTARPDKKLAVGAVLFGIGWALSGLCPGPALTALAAGSTPVLVFVAAMVAGMLVHDAGSSRTFASRSSGGA